MFLGTDGAALTIDDLEKTTEPAARRAWLGRAHGAAD